MEEIIVRGGNQLNGTVRIEGAKNAVLPILAASLLAEEGITTLDNVPILSDVFTMNQVIRHLNVDVDFDEQKNQVTIDASRQLEIEAPYEYVSQMRASIVVMGPLLARNGHAKVAMPGGCAIGKRPIDLHLKGFQALGAKIIQKNGYIEAIADELIGNTIYLDFPSVGATQNIMMAAVKAKGTTIIENVAREPEIVDLANILNKMGAQVYGAGTETMRIKTNSIHQIVSSLSGGNQQKVVLSKWLMTQPDILFLDEPTRGIDVGAKYEIYTIIEEMAANGKAVCLISSELPEILGMCDRIYTMNEGRITGEVSREEADQEVLMKLMTKEEVG